MKLQYFWNQWEKPYRVVYITLLVLLALAMMAYGAAYLNGSSLVISWITESIISAVPTVWRTYWLGMYEFPITIDNYLLLQNFSTSGLQVNLWPAYLLLGWMALFLSIVLALMPSLSRFWFVISVGLFTLLLIGFKLEFLVLFNSYQKYGIGVGMLLYFPLLYVFHFLRPNTSIIIRIGSFFAATIVFAFIIYKFSYVPLPFLHLANYGIYVPLILTILFCFMVGHEIVSGLLAIISGSGLSGEKGGLYHFLIISSIFLINVTLVLLKNARIFDWDLYLIGAFGLLSVSTIIGIWGYRWRENTYEGTFSFFPVGAYLYLGLAITAHVTIAYFFVTGNDALVESVEDAIIFSQLAFGIMFLVYFLANFFDMMRENADVAKVVFKPRRMPYFTSGFAAVIFILALFLRFHMSSYNQAVAGYYSGVADLYLIANDDNSAREYYNLANIYSTNTHRGNYAMATLEHKTGKSGEEIRYLKQAISKNPTPYAYATLASRLSDEKKYLEAMLVLRDGIKAFPEEPRLMNNLGLIYTQLDEIDSAFQMFDDAMVKNDVRDIAGANVYALLRQQGLSVREDTLSTLVSESHYVPAINNLLVLANEKHRKIDDNGQAGFGTIKKTTIDEVVYNYNKTLNDPASADSSYFAQMSLFYDSLRASWFEEPVRYAGALAQFSQGNTRNAFQTLTRLALQSPEKEYYSSLGNLSMILGAWELATEYFENSVRNGHAEDAVRLAFAYMEAGQLDKAAFLWHQLQASADSSITHIAGIMTETLAAKSIDDVLMGNEETKLAFIRYRFRDTAPEKLEALAVSFGNENLKALAYLKLFDVYSELGISASAAKALEVLGELSLSEPRIIDDINLAQCRFAFQIRDVEMMKRIIADLSREPITIGQYITIFSQITTMTELYDAIMENTLVSEAMKNPFFEPVVSEAVNYLNRQENGVEKAYNILLHAVTSNPFSKTMNQAYAIQCLKMGFKDYAMRTREELRVTMGQVAFDAFNLQFEKELAQYEVKRENW